MGVGLINFLFAAVLILPAYPQDASPRTELTKRQMESIDVGRRAASVPGFAYSAELKDQNFVWTRKRLLRWLEKPQKDFPRPWLPISNIRTPSRTI